MRERLRLLLQALHVVEDLLLTVVHRGQGRGAEWVSHIVVVVRADNARPVRTAPIVFGWGSNARRQKLQLTKGKISKLQHK
mgnify:CR=1 FL=1